tara:strand:+ start:211 stop:504 length:294 start_codon:yes stop_codon:yes gene_type:complete
MAVGDVVGQTGSSFTFQPASSVQIMVSSVFGDSTSARVNGAGGISTGNITTGAGGNYNHNGIGYMAPPVMPRTFINNSNYIAFSGSGSKGFTGIQIA